MEHIDWDAQRRRMAECGVRLMDPQAVHVEPGVTVGAGTLLLPGTILRGTTTIGAGCTIGPNTMITDCTIGDEVTVNASQLSESTVGDRANIGPFAYVRPNCTIGAGAKVGDFVELKNTVLGDGSKIPHLTYAGDSDIGTGVNLGCGTITVNYDGGVKHRTVVEDGVFVGCNTNLVAPVTVEAGAYIGAGSTITRRVPAGSLAISRVAQEIVPDWAARRRARGKLK